MNPSDRWTDERLDDLANTVRTMRDLPMRTAVLENRVDTFNADLRADLLDCKRGIEKLHEIRAQERKERKADFRWMIGAIFTAAMLVIAALGLFLS